MIKSCDRALEEKDKALAKKTEEVEIADLAIKQLKETNAGLQTEVAELHEKQTSFWTNPFLWLTLGIIGGAVLTGVVTK